MAHPSCSVTRSPSKFLWGMFLASQCSRFIWWLKDVECHAHQAHFHRFCQTQLRVLHRGLTVWIHCGCISLHGSVVESWLLGGLEHVLLFVMLFSVYIHILVTYTSNFKLVSFHHPNWLSHVSGHISSLRVRPPGLRTGDFRHQPRQQRAATTQGRPGSGLKWMVGMVGSWSGPKIHLKWIQVI